MKAGGMLTVLTLLGTVFLIPAPASAQSADKPVGGPEATQSAHKSLLNKPAGKTGTFTAAQEVPSGTPESSVPEAPRTDNKLMK